MLSLRTKLHCLFAIAAVACSLHPARSESQELVAVAPSCLTVEEVLQRIQLQHGFKYDSLFVAVDTFYDACRAKESHAAAQQSTSKCEELKILAERLVSQGTKTQIDVESAAICVSEAKAHANEQSQLQNDAEALLRRLLKSPDPTDPCCPTVDPTLPWTIDELIAMAEQQNPQVICLREKIARLEARIAYLRQLLYECRQRLFAKHRCRCIEAELCAALSQLQRCQQQLEELLRELRQRISEEYESYSKLQASVDALSAVFPRVTTSHVDRALRQYGQGMLDIEVVTGKIQQHHRVGENRIRMESKRRIAIYRLRILAGAVGQTASDK